MSLATTLRLLAKARGLRAVDIANAIPRVGAATVDAWMRGDKLPARTQLDALARTFGVPAAALFAELARSLDPARTNSEHALLDAYRALPPRQQAALLDVATAMTAPPARRTTRKAVTT